MLIKRLILTLTFVYISELSFSQKCGIVSDNHTKAGIAYATISHINKSSGSISDAKGQFCIQTQLSNSNTDSIIVSALGYEQRLLSLNDFLKSDTVFLREKNVLLEEVRVKSRKNKTIDYGTFHKRWILYQASYNPNSSTLTAVRVENYDNIEGIITNLHYRLSPKKSEFIKKYRLRCRLFKNGEDNKPSEDILNDNIIVEATPEDKFINVDITSHNVSLHDKYVWIGIQTIGYIDKNDEYFAISDYQFGKSFYKKNDAKKVEKIMLISPSYMMSKDGVAKSKHLWSKSWSEIPPSKYNVPLFGITISY
ncbi:carboxypeptidase-like regulatory domain-containing protein [Arcicella rigui]|uniref:Carboxypeptidase-like regulatory domain-containing protein n=1 Tax=Arcicella rigui TaxID=797020 RepID=A0ABU5Q9H8_9BACT|nr:carboxypeptidase-like regulatory domain-containing protein [Arcicella rigui]MEA5139388.1 carboxypeptidase-like regulatory domain-containing protein [Arcicella rigui]